MKVYIEREAAIKAIESVPDGNWKSIRYAKEVKAIPAADVVPVVRCKDCKYSAVDFENMRYCKLVTYYNHVPDDWFCADGERRERNEQ